MGEPAKGSIGDGLGSEILDELWLGLTQAGCNPIRAVEVISLVEALHRVRVAGLHAGAGLRAAKQPYSNGTFDSC
jgi:hypothetical protein